MEGLWKDLIGSDYSYHRMPLNQVYSIYKRRYELKLQALEITDLAGYSIIFSCDGIQRADSIINQLLQADLPNSIFSQVGITSMISALRGYSGNFYHRFLEYVLAQLTRLWQNNELTNFQYLMHLNAASGRSYHDLTQYPGIP